MKKYTIGPKVRMDAPSLLKDLPADHPVYTRGYAVGEINSKNFSRSTAEKGSQRQNDTQLAKDTDLQEKGQPRSSETDTPGQPGQSSTDNTAE